jgi:polyhydroxyalkanoate synthase subunit PhaC
MAVAKAAEGPRRHRTAAAKGSGRTRLETPPREARERAQPSEDAESRNGHAHRGVVEGAVNSILGPNPFIGLDSGKVVQSAGHLLGRLSRKPVAALSIGGKALAEISKVVVGRSKIGPAKGDHRFTDPAWSDHPGYHRLMQSYLVLGSALHDLVPVAELDASNALRADFAITMLDEALAPTNAFWSNPAAHKRAYDTAGLSMLRGLRNLAKDVVRNGGMPRMVDTRPFKVGENIAATPGAVVYRDELCEVIQYTPSTGTVHQRPLVMIPPQINKYYILDLAKERSLTEFMVAQGIQFFTIAWRNPTREQRDLGLDRYVESCMAAMNVACEITGSEDCNLLGVCAGGVTMAALLGHLASANQDRVNSATFGVSVLDNRAPSMIGMFATEKSVALAIRRSQATGFLDGKDMARVFAWLRPTDLVWNYWVNNYLLGNDPPAFDILFWNGDNTRLSAALHRDFLELWVANSLAKPGALEVLGTPVELKQVKCETYVVAGATDHIAPWKGAYSTIQMLGGPTQFVLSSSGHIQSLVNPPGNPKASYFTGGPIDGSAAAWLRGAKESRDSWWTHWASWLGKRSGVRRPASDKLGSKQHPPLDAAPGRYVHEK